MFPLKLPLPLWGSSPSRNTLFFRPSPLIIPNGISITSAVFVWVPNAMLYNTSSLGEENPLNCPFPLEVRHPAGGGPSNGHRQYAQKFCKDRACGSGDILADRQIRRQTHRQKTHSRAHHNTSPPLRRRSNYRRIPFFVLFVFVSVCNIYVIHSKILAPVINCSNRLLRLLI